MKGKRVNGGQNRQIQVLCAKLGKLNIYEYTCIYVMNS